MKNTIKKFRASISNNSILGNMADFSSPIDLTIGEDRFRWWGIGDPIYLGKEEDIDDDYCKSQCKY